jgi:hypothetical protein
LKLRGEFDAVGARKRRSRYAAAQNRLAFASVLAKPCCSATKPLGVLRKISDGAMAFTELEKKR